MDRSHPESCCRFREGKRLSEEETEAFGKYFYHITAQRGSGEFALSHLLGPMAWARYPLEGRMHQMQASHLPGTYTHRLLTPLQATSQIVVSNLLARWRKVVSVDDRAKQGR